MAVEIWDAIRYERVLENSRTKPLVIECERRDEGIRDDVPQLVSPLRRVSPASSLLLGASGQPMGETPALVLPQSASRPASDEAEREDRTESRLFVVKALGHPEVLEETLFKELFGNLLARSFGIQTPEPAIVVLSEGFVNVIGPQLPASANIKLRVGYAVGCEYFAGLQPIGPEPKLSPSLLPQAAQIYAFDLLSDNADRHVRNPNCALRHGGFLAYDFESAFGFLRVVGAEAVAGVASALCVLARFLVAAVAQGCRLAALCKLVARVGRSPFELLGERLATRLAGASRAHLRAPADGAR